VYHHPPFLLIGLHSIGFKCKLINFNQYNLRFYIQDLNFFAAMYCFAPPFHKAKFYGVPSGDHYCTTLALEGNHPDEISQLTHTARIRLHDSANLNTAGITTQLLEQF
jgi:hypothetical protein